MPDTKQIASKEISVRMPTGHPPVMVNVMNVLTTDSQVIIDFGFVDPGLAIQLAQTENPIIDATLVNRVVMGEADAQQLLEKLQKILDLKKKKRGDS
jgi:hypothetical protein